MKPRAPVRTAAPAGPSAAAGAGAAAEPTGLALAGAAAGRAAPAATASSTSLRVMRPPSPVPVIDAGSTPRSAMRRRTTGEVSAAVRDAVDRDGSARRSWRRPVRARARAIGVGGTGSGAGSGSGAPARRRGRRLRASGDGSGSAAGAAAAAGSGGRGGGAGAAPPRLLGGRPASLDDREHGADADGLALGDPDLGEVAGRRRRHLGVDLVGRTPRTAARRPRPGRRSA